MSPWVLLHTANKVITAEEMECGRVPIYPLEELKAIFLQHKL